MSFSQILNEKVKKMNWVDVAMLKFCIIAFSLMFAKLFPDALSLHWGIYALLFVLFASKPVYSVLIKK